MWHFFSFASRKCRSLFKYFIPFSYNFFANPPISIKIQKFTQNSLWNNRKPSRHKFLLHFPPKHFSRTKIPRTVPWNRSINLSKHSLLSLVNKSLVDFEQLKKISILLHNSKATHNEVLHFIYKLTESFPFKGLSIWTCFRCFFFFCFELENFVAPHDNFWDYNLLLISLLDRFCALATRPSFWFRSIPLSHCHKLHLRSKVEKLEDNLLLARF